MGKHQQNPSLQYSLTENTADASAIDAVFNQIFEEVTTQQGLTNKTSSTTMPTEVKIERNDHETSSDICEG
ncbi:MAG: hypothetical protein U0520_01300 [Candidatus Saccharimonadales bacterium]